MGVTVLLGSDLCHDPSRWFSRFWYIFQELQIHRIKLWSDYLRRNPATEVSYLISIRVVGHCLLKT